MMNGQYISVDGFCIDGEDDHWIVNCPECDQEYTYRGFFDPEDVTKCDCGVTFTTKRVWVNDDEYIR
jgi:hypothetical protein